MRSTPVQPAGTSPAPSPVHTPVPDPGAVSPWTPVRVVVAALAGTATLAAVVLAAAGGGVQLLDHHYRDGDYLTSKTWHVSSTGHAVTVDDIDLDGLRGDSLLGTTRVRATAAEGSSIFIGIAPTEDAKDYLSGIGHSTLTELIPVEYAEHQGGAPSAPPADSDIWDAQASGPGTQTMTWKPTSGEWSIVVMNQDGSADVDVSAEVGATAPILPRAVRWLLAGSALAGLLGGLGLRFVQVSGRRRLRGAR